MSVAQYADFFTADALADYASDMRLAKDIPRPANSHFSFTKKSDPRSSAAQDPDDKSQLLLVIGVLGVLNRFFDFPFLRASVFLWNSLFSRLIFGLISRHLKEEAWDYRLLTGYVASIKKEKVKSANTTAASSYKMQVVCRLPWWSKQHDEMRYVFVRVNTFTSAWCPRLYTSETSAHLSVSEISSFLRCSFNLQPLKTTNFLTTASLFYPRSQ